MPIEHAPQTPLVQTTDTQARPYKTRKRREPEQRPGPVVLVVQKPATPRPTAATWATTSAVPSSLSSETLAANLAQIAPILVDIEHAQSFQFIDSQYESHYKRLSNQADLLLKEIKSRLRKTGNALLAP